MQTKKHKRISSMAKVLLAKFKILLETANGSAKINEFV